MELVPVNRSAPSPPRASPPRQPTDASSKRPVREERFKCRVCHRSHPLRYCKRFLDANYERRLRLVLLHRYCSRCLAHSHGAKNCQSKGMCEYCKEKHHTLYTRTLVFLPAANSPSSDAALWNSYRATNDRHLRTHRAAKVFDPGSA